MTAEPVHFELERFERLPATEASALVRIAGRFRSNEGGPLTPVELAILHRAGASRFPPLPEPGGGSSVPDGAGGLWRGAFSVPVELSEAGDAAYTLHAGAGSGFELPSPHERPLLATPARRSGAETPAAPDAPRAAAAGELGPGAGEPAGNAERPLAPDSQRVAADRARAEAERWVAEGAEVEHRILAAREALEGQRADMGREREELRESRQALERQREELDRDLDALRRDREELAAAAAERETAPTEPEVPASELAEARAEAEAERELRMVLERRADAQAESERAAREALERQGHEVERAWAAVERQLSEVAELQTRIAQARQTLAEVVIREELERVERARLEEELQARMEAAVSEGEPNAGDRRDELDRLRLEAVRGAELAASLERRIADVGDALAERGHAVAEPDFGSPTRAELE